MKRLFFGVLPLLFLALTGLARTQNPSPENGETAVYLRLITSSGKGEYDEENLSNCLKNHIEYYLWRKGWDFEFVLADSVLDLQRVREALMNGSYRYLLYVEARAAFKTEKMRVPEAAGRVETKSYPGVLKMSLNTAFCDLASSGSLEAGKVSSESRKSWIESLDGGESPSEAAGPEPADFVVKRALSEALGFLPSFERKIRPGATDIPIYLVIDREILADNSEGGADDLYATVEYASRSLRRQFGFGLEICGNKHLNVRGVSLSGTNLLFNTIVKAESPRNDTMMIAVFRPDSAEQFYLSDRALQVGLSDLGKQTLLVAELPVPNRMTREWRAFLNGQLLLHEVGHLLGAIHVSDISSVMNPRTTWVSPGRLDPLNAGIIRQGQAADLRSWRLTEYVRFVAGAIEKSDYKLADYPSTFFSYINLNRNQFRVESFGDDGVGKAIPFAVEGYEQYLLKNHDAAKRLFYMALVSDSTQAAVHYYLSKVTSDKLAKLHLKKSADMGFYQAIHEAGQGQ